MLRHLLKLIFLFCSWTGAAHAASINGLWSASNGDVLFLMQSTQGQILAVDLKTDKTVRHFFQGIMTGTRLLMKTRDGSASLDATVNDNSLTGSLTEGAQSMGIKANHSFLYKGSAYDGVWQLDGNERYYLYATLTLQGVPTVIVPYFVLADDGQVTSNNVFMGSLPKSGDAKTRRFTGISLIDFTTLKLNFTNSGISKGAVAENQGIAKFTAMKIHPTTRKSGQYGGLTPSTAGK